MIGATWKELAKENQKLRDALRKYGRHEFECHKDCIVHERCKNSLCICGLDQALSTPKTEQGK